MEDKNRGVVDLRCYLEAVGSEDGTGTYTHDEPASTKVDEEMITSSTEGGKEMQGEESGGGY